jgi:hypothetical protein
VIPAVTLLIAALLAPVHASRATSPWAGTWTFDLCHEDRRPDHDKDTFCREGKDRIVISFPAGSPDLMLCPSDPWGERLARLEPGGVLAFRTRDGLDVRLILGEDRSHFRGRFTGSGHEGRTWGRRIAGC